MGGITSSKTDVGGWLRESAGCLFIATLRSQNGLISFQANLVDAANLGDYLAVLIMDHSATRYFVPFGCGQLQLRENSSIHRIKIENPIMIRSLSKILESFIGQQGEFIYQDGSKIVGIFENYEDATNAPAGILVPTLVVAQHESCKHIIALSCLAWFSFQIKD